MSKSPSLSSLASTYSCKDRQREGLDPAGRNVRSFSSVSLLYQIQTALAASCASPWEMQVFGWRKIV